MTGLRKEVGLTLGWCIDEERPKSAWAGRMRSRRDREAAAAIAEADAPVDNDDDDCMRGGENDP